jgi:hypothetical protein
MPQGRPRQAENKARNREVKLGLPSLVFFPLTTIPPLRAMRVMLPSPYICDTTPSPLREPPYFSLLLLQSLRHFAALSFCGAGVLACVVRSRPEAAPQERKSAEFSFAL